MDNIQFYPRLCLANTCMRGTEFMDMGTSAIACSMLPLPSLASSSFATSFNALLKLLR